MFVSIITPFYNRKSLLEKTIISVINQTTENWELLLVDDGSNDGAEILAQNFAQKYPNIHYIKRNIPPKGAPTCRNIGINAAKGDYLMFLDSDDLLKPFCIEQRINAAKKYPNYDFLVFQVVRKINNHVNPWNSIKPDPLLQFIFIDSPWHTSSPLWKKSTLLSKKIYFLPQLKIWQDIQFHCSALLNNLSYKILTDSYPADVIYSSNPLSISQKAYPLYYRKSQLLFFKYLKNIITQPRYREALAHSLRLFILKLCKKQSLRLLLYLLLHINNIFDPIARQILVRCIMKILRVKFVLQK